MFKRLINTGATLCAIICLAVTFVAAGFLVCAGTQLPTRLLASATVNDSIYPYNHDELVEIAVAIREYSFGNHNQEELNEAMDKVLASAQNDGRAPAKAVGEEYHLDSSAISHLDDCYKIMDLVRIPLIIIALLAIAAAAHVRVRMGRKALASTLITTGAMVLALFVIAGAAAAIDFNAFFTLFHSLFFSAGTWTFWYKSLLICSLPEGFWMGMGIIWFATTALLSILSVCVGLRLRRRSNTRYNSGITASHFNR